MLQTSADVIIDELHPQPPATESFFKKFAFTLLVTGAGLSGMLLIFLSFGVKFWLTSKIEPNQGEKMAFWSYELGHFMLLEIGIGFITALVIALTVDISTRAQEKKEHEKKLQEIGENIFNALFRTAVDKELVREMYLALILPKFIREDLTLVYEFENVPGQGSLPLNERKLKLIHTFSFKAKNVTDQKVGYRVSPQIEALIKADASTPFKTFSLNIINADGGITGTVKTDSEFLNQNAEEKGIRHTLRNVPELLIEPNERIDFRMTIEKLCRISDMEASVTAHSARDLTLIVKTGKDVPPLDFIVDQAHRKDMEEIISVDSKPDLRTWKLNSAILPYQGVMLWWYPKLPKAG
jgi:hypothetical protein